MIGWKFINSPDQNEQRLENKKNGSGVLHGDGRELSELHEVLYQQLGHSVVLQSPIGWIGSWADRGWIGLTP